MKSTHFGSLLAGLGSGVIGLQILTSLAGASAPSAPVVFPPAPPFPLSASCQASSDQLGSFMAPLLKIPTHIILDSRLDGEHLREVQKAVGAWNAIGKQILGQPFFTVSQEALPSTVTRSLSLSCDENLGGSDYFYIVRASQVPLSKAEKAALKKSTPHGRKPLNESQWENMRLGDGSAAVDVHCGLGMRGPTTYLHQIVVVNTNSTSLAQFNSFVLHELGHALGLGHSCDKENLKNPNWKSCDKVSFGDAYGSAVMYPSLIKTLTDPMGQRKETPQPNDVMRLQCLYGSSSGPR